MKQKNKSIKTMLMLGTTVIIAVLLIGVNVSATVNYQINEHQLKQKVEERTQAIRYTLQELQDVVKQKMMDGNNPILDWILMIITTLIYIFGLAPMLIFALPLVLVAVLIKIIKCVIDHTLLEQLTALIERIIEQLKLLFGDGNPSPIV